MAGNILNFPGSTTANIEPDTVLEACVGKLNEVMIIGEAKEGSFYAAMSNPKIGEALVVLEVMRRQLVDSAMVILDD